MIGQGMHGFVGNRHTVFHFEDLENATDSRIFDVAEALQRGYSVEQIHRLTHIDRWFLSKMSHIVSIDRRLHEYRLLGQLVSAMEPSELLELIAEPAFSQLLGEAKRYGFSDFQIARAVGLEDSMTMEAAGLTVRQWREELDIRPIVRQIDTLAAEYPAQTNYLYLTY